jgi:head-tail adaptor
LADETGGGVRIGRLRWLVALVQRQQTPTPGSGGITEIPVNLKLVHADIQSTNDATFWGSAQTDTPITHAIYIRWQDYPDNTIAIVRSTDLPDGSTRKETFRVRKVSELGGRKRFVRLLCQLENAVVG